MEGLILDTSFLVDLLRGNPSAVNKLDELEENREIIFLTPVNAFKIHYGARKYGKDGGLEEIELLLESIKVLEIGWADGLRAAELHVNLESRGEKIELFDVLTAAVALRVDESVLTRSPTHFERISELDVETY